MAEPLIIDTNATKEEKYRLLVPQIRSLVAHETDLIANLANIAAALKQAMNFFWVGFYLNSGKDLVLGPFQGTIACTRIPYDKGVCGTCFRKKEVIIVEDVEKFPGHIACSTLSRSEIVLPVLKGEAVRMVLDVDSDQLADFDATDAYYLSQVCEIISNLLT
ncbi:MAG: GAF domain-containing protein [Flammeovirgaceae bacterium]|nr:GAF domain-containing protein [Flammeovirgaceae bacterium]MDW8288610.1 GAF domain-containing protein [Flammeovirgaceae bacterium]